MRLSICLGTAYLAEIKNLFAESNVNKGKSWSKSIMRLINSTQKS